MLERLKNHDPGMRLLIVYLYGYSLYVVGNTVTSFYPLIQRILDSQSQSQVSISVEQGGFFSPGTSNPGIWQLVFNLLPTVGASVVLTAGGATGLLLRRRWGWWLAAVFGVSLLLPGLPLVVYQFFFMEMPPNGQTLAELQPYVLTRQIIIILSGVIALCYLCSRRVMTTMQVDRSRPGNTIAALVGLSLLLYAFYFIPTLIGILFRLVMH